VASDERSLSHSCFRRTTWFKRARPRGQVVTERAPRHRLHRLVRHSVHLSRTVLFVSVILQPFVDRSISSIRPSDGKAHLKNARTRFVFCTSRRKSQLSHRSKIESPNLLTSRVRMEARRAGRSSLFSSSRIEASSSGASVPMTCNRPRHQRETATPVTTSRAVTSRLRFLLVICCRRTRELSHVGEHHQRRSIGISRGLALPDIGSSGLVGCSFQSHARDDEVWTKPLTSKPGSTTTTPSSSDTTTLPPVGGK
jgi:hypothetical protein